MSIRLRVSEREHPQKCHFLYFLERPLQQFCTTVQTVITNHVANSAQLQLGDPVLSNFDIMEDIVLLVDNLIKLQDLLLTTENEAAVLLDEDKDAERQLRTTTIIFPNYWRDRHDHLSWLHTTSSGSNPFLEVSKDGITATAMQPLNRICISQDSAQDMVTYISRGVKTGIIPFVLPQCIFEIACDDFVCCR